MIVTKQVIKDQMPDVFPFIGWSDLHLKNAGKELQEAIETGNVVMQATIRPMTWENISSSGFGAYQDRHEISLLVAHPTKTIDDVAVAVERIAEFPIRLRNCLFEFLDSEKNTGFSEIKVSSALFPVRDRADDFALADVRVEFTTKGNFNQEINNG